MLPWKGILHMHNANDQILSLLYSPPKVSELKRKHFATEGISPVITEKTHNSASN